MRSGLFHHVRNAGRENSASRKQPRDLALIWIGRSYNGKRNGICSAFNGDLNGKGGKASTSMTLDNLLQRLRNDGHLDDGSMSRLSSHIITQNSPANYPWFIKAAIAFVAWVAALSFLFFFGAIGYFTPKVGLVVIGITAIGV